MDRNCTWMRSRSWSCPHARGDEPRRGRTLPIWKRLSPRPWGWTDERHQKILTSERCPHARGDGPNGAAMTDNEPQLSPRSWGWTGSPPFIGDSRCRLSPRSWGWTERKDSLFNFETLSPRSWGWTDSPVRQAPDLNRCPHARGDGPANGTARLRSRSCPHARGDGPRGGHLRSLTPVVVPTLVGMDRKEPTTRQHGPVVVPRSWGWTAGRVLRGKRQGVVPTLVGMDRNRGPVLRPTARCPHARGDGPKRGNDKKGKRDVVPTLVGMDRRKPRFADSKTSVVPTLVGMDRPSVATT